MYGKVATMNVDCKETKFEARPSKYSLIFTVNFMNQLFYSEMSIKKNKTEL